VAKGLLRRGVSLVAATSLAVLPTVTQSRGAAAATSGVLFAVTGSNQSVLSRLDPVSGTITPIEDLAGPDQGQLVSITGDPATHRIFAFRTSVSMDQNGGFVVKNQVLTIDSQTGAFSESPLVNAPIGLVAYDPSANALYGLSFNGVYTLDPTTGAAALLASLENVNPYILDFAVVPGAHTIYVNNFVQNFDGTSADQLRTVDSRTGALSSPVTLAQPTRIISYDTSLGALFGATECCPRQLQRIDPATGAETAISAFNNDQQQSLQFSMTIDPASHTVFMDIETFVGFNTTQDQIVSVNDQTGATGLSIATNDIVWSQYFEAAVMITPESIKHDVEQALTTGGITKEGVARSLLAELNAAAKARSRSDCGKAAQSYGAFIKELEAQSGKSVSATTASLLISEAQYLIGHCTLSSG
jgi:FIMAH domain-containing protein